MHDLKKEWAKKVPKYSLKFKPLFEKLSQKYGAEGEKKNSRGKYFSNNYELYIYAFFLGLYKGKKIPLLEDEEKEDFSHPIDRWGSKSTNSRKDFTELQDYMFMAVVAETEFDFHRMEIGKDTSASVTKKLITTFESYANGGLHLISESYEDSSNFFLKPTAFLDFIADKSAYSASTAPPFP
jgi:hypothetical protein